MSVGLRVKCMLLWSDFNQHQKVSTNFSKNPKHEVSQTSLQWEFIQTTERTDIHEEATSRLTELLCESTQKWDVFMLGVRRRDRLKYFSVGRRIILKYILRG